MGQQSQKVAEIANVQSGFQQYQQELIESQKSDITPYYEKQIRYLEGIFQSLDSKKLKTIEIHDLREIFFIRQHILFQRIMDLFEEETKKLKVKRITFEIILHLLSIFHVLTDIQAKYQYLFRLYDWDKDFKLTSTDLVKTFSIMLRGPIYTQECYQLMTTQSLAKYGSKGQIKFQSFREYLPEEQVKEIMTLKFYAL